MHLVYKIWSGMLVFIFLFSSFLSVCMLFDVLQISNLSLKDDVQQPRLGKTLLQAVKLIPKGCFGTGLVSEHTFNISLHPHRRSSRAEATGANALLCDYCEIKFIPFIPP